VGPSRPVPGATGTGSASREDPRGDIIGLSLPGPSPQVPGFRELEAGSFGRE